MTKIPLRFVLTNLTLLWNNDLHVRKLTIYLTIKIVNHWILNLYLK